MTKKKSSAVQKRVLPECQVVEVVWLDASETTPNEELTPDQYPVIHTKYQVGYLESQSDVQIRLRTIENDHGTSDWMIAIPKCSVVKMVYLDV